MALATACDPRSAGRLAAIVMVNAAIDEGVLARCASGAPVALPLSAVAGVIDRTVLYDGGRGLLSQASHEHRLTLHAAQHVLAQHGINIRAVDPRQWNGLRASLHVYNDDAQVERFVAALHGLLG